MNAKESKSDISSSERSTVLTPMETRRSPEYQSIYSNNTRFGITAFELSMTFGEILETPDGDFYVDQKARVLMSWLHAKVFALVLTRNIQNFEAQFGEINVPSGATPADPVSSAEAARE